MELLVICAGALVAVAVVLASLRITAALAGAGAWRGLPRATGGTGQRHRWDRTTIRSS